MTGLLVDVAAAREFVEQMQAQCDQTALVEVAHAAQQKSNRLHQLLGDPETVPSADQLREALAQVFSVRRRSDALLAEVGPERLGAVTHDLLHGDAPLSVRWRRFVDVVGNEPDLPAELLHFTFPERWWLWTRWMWDPQAETGALALVTESSDALFASDSAAGYRQVGAAVAMVSETVTAAGLDAAGDSVFATDVFLGAVYGVYMYTVLRLRMTQEFNRMVPRLPELVGRLLGVHRRTPPTVHAVIPGEGPSCL